MTAERRLIVGEISGAIFLSEELNKEIFRMAEALTNEPVVRPSGAHQPLIHLWSVDAEDGIPGEFLEIFFDAFADAYFKPLELAEYLVISSDGMISVVFKEHKMINVIRDESIRVFSKSCDGDIATIATGEDVWTPAIFLGHDFKENSFFNLRIPYEKMFPERLAVGHFTRNYGFKKIMERSNKGR